MIQCWQIQAANMSAHSNDSYVEKYLARCVPRTFLNEGTCSCSCSFVQTSSPRGLRKGFSAWYVHDLNSGRPSRSMNVRQA